MPTYSPASPEVKAMIHDRICDTELYSSHFLMEVESVVRKDHPEIVESIGLRNRRNHILKLLGTEIGVVPMTQNLISFVDPEDIGQVSLRLWCPVGPRSLSSVYAHACGFIENNIRKNITMHELIMGQNPGMKIDHKNGLGLDNRKGNLRVCTHQQNTMNGRNRSNSTSGFKGVSWFKRDNNWRSYIVIDAKQRHLGYFDQKIDAALAYDKAAVQLFGEFARLNFP